tara:strand:+ start:508 stop:783 length:276 start_codon:yes stop_codon:yes gene_type:complete
MSNKPTKTFWGNIKKKEIEEVLKIEGAVTVHEKYGEQIKVKAAQWESGNITIQFWHKEANKNIDVLVLRPQTDGTYSVNSVDDDDDDDMPF